MRTLSFYRPIVNLSVVYGCETWSLTVRGERRPTVCENRVWRRIFGSKRDEVTGEWRRRHNEELYDQYCSPNNIRLIKSGRKRWAGHLARMGESRGVYRVLVGKPERKRPLGRRRRMGRQYEDGPSGSGMWGHGLDLSGSGWLRVVG
jgi:hypothetical protein